MPNLKLLNGETHLSDATGFIETTVTLAERLLDLGVESALIMDGYDDCAIGVLERFGMESIVIYDKEKVIQQLIDEGCDDYEGANEFYEFNQLGGWHGDLTPGFLIKLPATS
tara:strand:+ start:123 stop:458 length:336 start_codon:yes stop_codon:yes gene_type:complete